MKRLGEPPYICLITPGKLTPSNFNADASMLLETIREACQAGVNMVQIREKGLPGRMLFELATRAIDITSALGATLLINDRADVALAAGADGVHLPENSVPLNVLREGLAAGMIVGVSTHSTQAVSHALEQGADYVLWGPVFETPGKGPAKGLTELSDVVAAARGGDVIAVGGIDEDNAVQILEAGAAGVAAIRTLNDPSSRDRLLASLRAA